MKYQITNHQKKHQWEMDQEIKSRRIRTEVKRTQQSTYNKNKTENYYEDNEQQDIKSENYMNNDTHFDTVRSLSKMVSFQM